MIPKIMHYVWLGGQPKPPLVRHCLSSWERWMPDYQLLEWNEGNIDIQSIPYARQAYEQKKWAYVSDYLRAQVIWQWGGIYLDTDVVVVDRFDAFLKHQAFVGFENEDYPFTAVFGAQKGHPFVRKMLDMYQDQDFVYDPASPFDQVNTKTVSDLLIQEYGCLPNNQKQILADGLVVYPDDVLCNPSMHSVAIHVFSGSWLEQPRSLRFVGNQWLKWHIRNPRQAAWFRKYIMHKKER